MPVSPAALRDLALLSERVGTDIQLVQGAGGNASLEANGTLWIKASGTWLAEALDRDIFLPLDVVDVRRRLAGSEPEPLAGLTGPGGLRPSIETSLHALMPQAVVLHVHSVATIAHAVRRDGDAAVSAKLGGLRWAWVPYRRPGVPLTRAIETVLAESDHVPDVLILANHGLVVAGATVAAVDALLADVESRLRCDERAAPSLLPPEPASDAWRLPSDPAVHAVATDPVALAHARTGVLYPDHVVFLGAGWPEILPKETTAEAVERHASAFGRAPVFLVSEGTGVIVSTDITPGAEQMLQCLSLVTRRLTADQSVATLDDADAAALLDWDAEKYRQALDRA